MPINGAPLARVSALECQLQVESVMDERQSDCDRAQWLCPVVVDSASQNALSRLG